MDKKKLLSEIGTWVDSERDNYIRDLISLINIKSVAGAKDGKYSMGLGCANALEWMLDKGQTYGLITENDEYYCGSLIYPGTTEREVALVGHLDVVEAGNQWTFDPYDAQCIQGHIVGRGSADNKGACVAVLYTLKYLSRMGVELKHSVRGLFGCQEESGMEDVKYFLRKHDQKLPELCLVADCPFPVHHGEMGRYVGKLKIDVLGSNLNDFKAESAAGGVPDYAEMEITGVSEKDAQTALQKCDVEISASGPNRLIISAYGKSGHPSTAEQGGAVNAIGKLAGIMAEAALLDKNAQQAVSFLAEAYKDFRGTGLGIDYQDKLSGRTLLVSRNVSIRKGILESEFLCRYPIGADWQRLLATLQKNCAANGFKIEEISHTDPWYVPLDWRNNLPLKLAELSCSILGRPELKPVTLPAGTYSHLLPNALGYGPALGPEFLPVPRYGYPHGPDESVSVEDMLRALKVYITTMLNIDELLPEGKAA